MCGRYAFFDFGNLSLRFGITNNLTGFEPTKNASPTMQLPIIFCQSPPQVYLASWGLYLNNKLINARAETVMEKPTFKRLALTKRCIVPVNGFYEWDKLTHKPVYFSNPINPVMGLAGLWDGEIEAGKESTISFTIMTKAANHAVSPHHERMPVVIPIEQESNWLDIKTSPVTLLKAWLSAEIGREIKGQELERIPNNES